VFFDTLTVSACTTLAKVMGAGKALALARVFGSSASLDSYLLAFLAPSFLADVFCGSLLPVLVPKLVELRYREGEAKALELYAHVLWRSLLLASIAAAILAAVAAIVATLGAGSARINLHLLGIVTLLMTPILPLAAVANVLSALRANRALLPVSSAALVVNTVLNYALMAHSGVAGIALAASSVQALVFAALAILVFRRGPSAFLTDCDADAAPREWN